MRRRSRTAPGDRPPQPRWNPSAPLACEVRRRARRDRDPAWDRANAKPGVSRGEFCSRRRVGAATRTLALTKALDLVRFRQATGSSLERLVLALLLKHRRQTIPRCSPASREREQRGSTGALAGRRLLPLSESCPNHAQANPIRRFECWLRYVCFQPSFASS